MHSQMLKGAYRKTPPFTVGLERLKWYHNNVDQKQIKVSQNEGTPSPFRGDKDQPQQPSLFGSNTLGSWAVTSARWETSAASESFNGFLLDHVWDNQWNFLILFSVIFFLVFSVLEFCFRYLSAKNKSLGSFGCRMPKRSQGSVQSSERSVKNPTIQRCGSINLPFWVYYRWIWVSIPTCFRPRINWDLIISERFIWKKIMQHLPLGVVRALKIIHFSCNMINSFMNVRQ